MTIHYLMKHLSAELNDDRFLLLVDLLTEAKDNSSSDLFLQVDEDGRADVEALSGLTVDGKPLFADVTYTQNGDLLDVRLTLGDVM